MPGQLAWLQAVTLSRYARRPVRAPSVVGALELHSTLALKPASAPASDSVCAAGALGATAASQALA